MSKKYRELMRKHGDVEMKFPRAKSWREDMLSKAAIDQSFATDEDYQHAIHGVWRDYYQLVEEYTKERLEIEEQIRDELELMNSTPTEDRVQSVHRPDGKLDFGRTFLFLVDQIRILSEKLDKIFQKLTETNRVLVDSE